MFNFIEHLVLLAHLAKGHVSFCHHLASVLPKKPAILPYVLFLVTAAMLVGARLHRTQFRN
jgi:hypothetical protein